MIVETTRFGPLEVEPSEVITVPRGLIGFPPEQRFTLVPHAPGHPFLWLQSLDDPALAFVVANPHAFFPDYEVDLSDDEAMLLGIEQPHEAEVLTTVTVRRTPPEVTANLLGPLVIGARTRRAAQVVQDGDRYSTRQPLPTRPAEASTASASSAAAA